MRKFSILVIMILVFQLVAFLVPVKPVYAADPVANFVDPNLKSAVANWLGKSVSAAVYESEIIAKLDAQAAGGSGRTFSAISYGITNLSGMDIFNGTNLEYLEFRGNNITDLAPLSGITSLKYLNLQDSKNVTNLSPLGGFSNLRQLILGDSSGMSLTNPTKNLTAISTMTGLEEFTCKSCGLTSITPLNSHPALKKIWLDNNRITDLSPLSNVTTITTLSLFNNGLPDIAPLSTLINMDDLTFQQNSVTNITALSSMTILRVLGINDNPITDFTPLSALSSIRNLTADKTSIKDLSVIQNNTNMQWLSLQDTPVNSIAPLAGMNSLNFLSLQRAQVSDISALNGKITIATIWLGDNYINHWSAGSSKAAKDSITPTVGYGIWTPQKRIAVSDSGGILTNVNLVPTQNKSVTQITQQTANGTTWGASSEIWPATYFYSSSDPTVAYIDQATMTLKAIADGTATITAKRGSAAANGFNSYSFNVTVTTPTLNSITVLPISATVNVGGTRQYTATANFSDGSTQNVTALSTWTTGNTATATIDNVGLATGQAVGSTSITATWNGKIGNATIIVTTAPPAFTGYTIAPSTATILQGQTQQYTLAANFSDGSTQNVTGSAVWDTLNPGISTMTATKGLAKGNTVGITKVRAQLGGQTLTADLIVTAPAATLTGITVTPATATIQVGNTQQYKATANFSDGTTQDVTNVAAWTLVDPSKANIDASGLATGNAAGNTGVTATWNAMTGNASLTVTTLPVPVTLQSITVTPVIATIQVGNTQQYTATANYSNGTTQDVTNVAAWALVDPTKATINASGLATGTAEGNTGVSATWNAMTGNASLTITTLPVPVTLQSITVTPVTATIQVGNTQQYTATANYSNGTTQNVTNVAAWALVDPSKATIDASGLATGNAAGNTGVTATWNAMTGNASLVVTATPVKPPVTPPSSGGGSSTSPIPAAAIVPIVKTSNPSPMVTAEPVKIMKLEVLPKNATIFVGEIQEFKATVYYSDNTTKDVSKDASWTVKDRLIASIQKGRANGLSVGKTDVTAQYEGQSDNANLNVRANPVTVFPDLTPQLVVPDQVKVGDNFKLIVTLKNIGKENVTDDFKANVYVRKITDKAKNEVTIASSEDIAGWTLLGSHIIKSGLKSGEATGFEMPLQLLEKGTYEIKVIADEENITADVDRSNNQEQKVTIAVKEEEPTHDPEQPLVPQTGDGSLAAQQSNTGSYMLLVVLAVGILARRFSRKVT